MSQQELPFVRREEFEAELNRRGLSENACSILLLMFEAANGSGPPGIVGKFHAGSEPCYLMHCEYGQLALARYCNIRSDSTFRAICVRLQAMGFFQRRTVRTTSGKATVYCLRLGMLMELPVSTDDSPIGQVLEMLEQRSLNAVFGVPQEGDVRRATVDPVQPAERQTETNPGRNLQFTARLKSVNTENERLLMSSITDADVRLIAGFAPAEGPRRVPTDEQRLALFARYWADAKLRDQALTSNDCLELLALFINKGRNAPRPGKSANPRGAAVATWWRNRREQPLKNTLRKIELDEALRLLAQTKKPESAASGESSAEEVVKPKEVKQQPVKAEVSEPSEAQPLRRLDMSRITKGLQEGKQLREMSSQDR